MSELTLREICKVVGVTRRAIQCYEKIGMVQSTGKNKYGYLLYGDVAVNKIRTIKKYLVKRREFEKFIAESVEI